MSQEANGKAPTGNPYGVDLPPGVVAVFQVGLYSDGQMRYTAPVGCDDVYVRGMMEKMKDAIVFQMTQVSPLAI